MAVLKYHIDVQWRQAGRHTYSAHTVNVNLRFDLKGTHVKRRYEQHRAID